LFVSCNRVQIDVHLAHVPPVETPDPGTGTPALPPGVTADSPLALRMSTKFLLTNFNKSLTFLETGTDSCVATTTNPVVTCTVKIPEGRLFYSSVKLAYSWLPNNCRILGFQPYYYRASISATYFPPGAKADSEGIDCSGATTVPPAACYGGAAPDLVSEFPVKNRIAYFPDENNLTLPSKASVEISAAASKEAGSNRMTVNDLPLAKRATTYTPASLGNIGDGYRANTFTDYIFTCRDEWADDVAYQITLNITEEDSSAAGPNNFLTWKELP
jgi:hypothetical protein